jgi:hypothetical protein
MTPPPSWESLLRTPHPRDHVVQLYTHDDFLGRAVAHFLGGGLRDGEGFVVIATPAHIDMITDRLVGTGVNVVGATARRQLVNLDAQGCLEQFIMMDGMPDRATFLATISPVLERVRAAGYPSVRLFGEMVNLLWDQNLDATIRLEELWNEILADEGVSLLCAYRIDRSSVN